NDSANARTRKLPPHPNPLPSDGRGSGAPHPDPLPSDGRGRRAPHPNPLPSDGRGRRGPHPSALPLGCLFSVSEVAKRMECVQLAAAVGSETIFERSIASDSGSKLHALQRFASSEALNTYPLGGEG